MTNQQILRRLRLEFVAYVLLAVLLVVLYETHVFAKGALVGDVSAIYVAECAGILLAVVLTPVALKSFHKALVRMVYMDDDAARRRCYVKWNEIRLAMFVTVVLVNLSVYYMTADNMCGYCALIGAIASLFCWPTKEGVATELTMKEEPLPEQPSLENPTEEAEALAAEGDETDMEA
ncbi:MAG: hypothetical protein IKS80_04005 [Bacteroidaceae bacterium]|nr:hypothetical protein [Bacteroidaceae bacterium]